MFRYEKLSVIEASYVELTERTWYIVGYSELARLPVTILPYNIGGLNGQVVYNRSSIGASAEI